MWHESAVQRAAWDRLRLCVSESSLEKERETPSPIDPNCVEVDVNFNPDPADLVLSSVPGGELFNPRKHKFAEEDLKPQPMIKKAKKVFVPDEQKVILRPCKWWCSPGSRAGGCASHLVLSGAPPPPDGHGLERPECRAHARVLHQLGERRGVRWWLAPA